jgi:GntR family transcriptional repressor for pyruvate dehydrogenase complex
VRSRRGSGTYIPDGPPALGVEALSFIAALHKFTVDDVYEARRVVEVGAAGLAAERATPEHLATLADDVAGLFASLTERQVFLAHDVNFHRGVAAASGNPIVASMVEMVSALHSEWRRTTVERAVDRELRDAADAHRQIYQAIRARDADRARRAMNDHLVRARSYQARETTARRTSNPGVRAPEAALSSSKGEARPPALRQAERRPDPGRGTRRAAGEEPVEGRIPNPVRRRAAR